MSDSGEEEPPTPLSGGFEVLCFTPDGEVLADDEIDSELDRAIPRDPRREYHYEPGVIRKMKKSGKYTLNSDVFENKSRPVSVASLYELSDKTELDGNSVTNTGAGKEEKFDNVHKPVLFLKSCPSPATFLQKKVLPDRESLLGKLSVLESIINDINSARIHDEFCETCGFEHHATEQCLLLTTPDAFVDSDTEIHCNPAFSGIKEQSAVQFKGSGKRKKKKRRKVFKFGDFGNNSSDSG